MDINAIDPRAPQFLAFWTKCLREASHWSQEALAESSGLNVRTIQRIEAGEHRVSISTLRRLASGLGYENPKVFEEPEFIKEVSSLLQQLQKINADETHKRYPEHLRVEVVRVTNGQMLAQVAYQANAYLFHADEGLPEAAREIAAAIFDYLRDLGDLWDDGSYTDRLTFQRSLQDMLTDLEANGVICYRQFRATKITSQHWADKTPLSLTIGYLTCVPAEKVLTDMMVPRRLS